LARIARIVAEWILNPMRAARARAPGDWPWRRARAHLAGADDDLVRVRPSLELAPDWREFPVGGQFAK